MAGNLSIKRSLIEKSNSTIVAVTSVACFVVVFSVVSSWSLVNQFMYQNRIIDADNDTITRLKSDISSTASLESSYNTFIGAPTNIIGGSINGSGPQDGSNAKIVLDALPSKYDYPALVTSLEGLLTGQAAQIQSITGSDDAVSQEKNQSSSTPAPQAMPFQIVANGNYGVVQKLIGAFERSTRPIKLQTLDLSGNQSQLVLTVSAETYWQPAKNLEIRSKIIK